MNVARIQPYNCFSNLMAGPGADSLWFVTNILPIFTEDFHTVRSLLKFAKSHVF